METPAWMESKSVKPSQYLLNGNAELKLVEFLYEPINILGFEVG